MWNCTPTLIFREFLVSRLLPPPSESDSCVRKLGGNVALEWEHRTTVSGGIPPGTSAQARKRKCEEIYQAALRSSFLLPLIIYLFVFQNAAHLHLSLSGSGTYIEKYIFIHKLKTLKARKYAEEQPTYSIKKFEKNCNAHLYNTMQCKKNIQWSY